MEGKNIRLIALYSPLSGKKAGTYIFILWTLLLLFCNDPHGGWGIFWGAIIYFKPSKKGVDFFVSPVGLGELRHTQMRCTKL